MILYNNKKEKYKKAFRQPHPYNSHIKQYLPPTMNIIDQIPYQYTCFEYSQDYDLFESILNESSTGGLGHLSPENKIQQLFSCGANTDQLLNMPSERFEMISAGSLDNSGDLFEEDQISMKHDKLFSIESFFNCGGSAEKPEDSTHDHISSS